MATQNRVSVNFVTIKRYICLKITKVLAANNIDLRAINVAEAQEYGVIRIIVDNYEQALKVLNEHEYVNRSTPVVVVALKDEVGSLSNLLSDIQEGNFNIEYMYSIFSQIDNRALMVLKVKEPEKLESMLLAKGYNNIENI